MKIEDYFALFDSITWQAQEQCDWLQQYDSSLLLEQESLSRRLMTYCDDFKAQLVSNEWQQAEFIANKSLLFSEQFSEKCLQRDVILTGDGTPWLLGRSFIPQSTAKQAGFDLEKQGDKPLGLTLFQQSLIHREPVKLARIEHSSHCFEHDSLVVNKSSVSNNNLVARCSTLSVNQKPLVVMELFLPSSPVYRTLS